MVSLLPTLLRTALGRPPRLVCDSRLWNEGVDELKRRAAGKRESGAFILGSAKGRTRRIEQFLFYDDVDPNCFAHGIVEFDGTMFGIVWQKCRDAKMTIVADVHVHPGHSGQSSTDRHNPMIPETGHLALIIPHFAARDRLPGKIGIHEYLGARQWHDHSPKGSQLIHIGWWPR